MDERHLGGDKRSEAVALVLRKREPPFHNDRIVCVNRVITKEIPMNLSLKQETTCVS